MEEENEELVEQFRKILEEFVGAEKKLERILGGEINIDIILRKILMF